jgi:hypothetical protein
METLIFKARPVVTIAGNSFVNVPIILQVIDTPLIEVVSLQEAGFTSRISVYHEDGTYLAKVVGAQIYKTRQGAKAGLEMRYPPGMTVCEMGGRTLFELTRSGAAALKGQAELYAPTGAFVKCADDGLRGFVLDKTATQLKIGGVTMTGCTVSNSHIGILVDAKGGIAIAVNRPKPKPPPNF